MRRSYLLGLLVFLITAAVMGRTVSHEFTWYDDAEMIHQNPRLRDVKWANVAWYWTHADFAIYIPLTETFWAGLAVLGRVEPGEHNINVNPYVFHAVSVAAHALAAVALCALVSRLFGPGFAAAAGALVFGLHPVQVESVPWAT